MRYLLLMLFLFGCTSKPQLPTREDIELCNKKCDGLNQNVFIQANDDLICSCHADPFKGIPGFSR